MDQQRQDVEVQRASLERRRDRPAHAPASWLNSTIRLHGEITEDLRRSFYPQLESAPLDQPLVVEVFTRGGDADIGRLIACEIKLQREHAGRETIFLGRSTVYSAGVVIMSAFEKETRFLSRDAALMIHGRQLERTLNISGSIRSSIADVRSLLAQMETAIELERQDFDDLAAGSTLTAQQIWERSETNWYLTAQQALDLGLVEGLFIAGPAHSLARRHYAAVDVQHFAIDEARLI